MTEWMPWRPLGLSDWGLGLAQPSVSTPELSDVGPEAFVRPGLNISVVMDDFRLDCSGELFLFRSAVDFFFELKGFKWLPQPSA